MNKVDLFDLTGEIAVVIGGTGVLGGAITEGLAMAGAKAAILGRTRIGARQRPNPFRITAESPNFSLPTLSIVDRSSLRGRR